MAWGKIDDRLHSTRKWRRATKPARALWTTALSWCMAELTDGHVPRDMLALLDGKPAEAQSLVDAGLWHEGDDGWDFHDWLDYQYSREQILSDRAASAERQRKAREKAKEKRDREAGVTPYVTAKSQRESRRESQVQSRSPQPNPTQPNPISSGHLDIGGEPSQRASNEKHPPQPCGKNHDPERNCGACANARRKAKDDEVAALKAKRAAEREANARAKAEREAEAERAKAEAEANPEAVEQAKAKARAAVKARKS